jgi:ribosomal protein S18 acetylase RimI-like enzyme
VVRADEWAALRRQIQSIHDSYGDALVEQFVDGRELNASLIALPELEVLPLAEIEFRDGAGPWRLVTYDAKWAEGSADHASTPVRCPAQVEPELAERIAAAARGAFLACGCRDYARVDLRVSPRGEVFVLEVNANPDASPGAGLWRALEAKAPGGYADFARRLVEAAAGRASGVLAGGGETPPAPSSPPALIRGLEERDLEALVALLEACGNFRPDEVAIGREVLVEALRDGPEGHYQVLVAELDGVPVGWSAHGLVPLTDGTWDLYWIAVQPRCQGRGVGRQLIARIERELRPRGARWLLAETSGSDRYQATRAFYARAGFELLSRIPDFYRAGDPREIYGRRIGG